MTRVFVLTNHKGRIGKSTSATTEMLRRAGCAGLSAHPLEQVE